MLNGQFTQWMDEARQHWQGALAASSVIKTALPFQEWIRIAVVAIVTAVVTSQVTLARLDERLIAATSEIRDLRVEIKDISKLAAERGKTIPDIIRRIEALERRQ